jgi:hypothetical protein
MNRRRARALAWGVGLTLVMGAIGLACQGTPEEDSFTQAVHLGTTGGVGCFKKKKDGTIVDLCPAGDCPESDQVFTTPPENPNGTGPCTYAPAVPPGSCFDHALAGKLYKCFYNLKAGAIPANGADCPATFTNGGVCKP